MVKWHLHLLGHTVAIAKDHADRSRETELIFASFLVLALSCGLMALYGAEPPDSEAAAARREAEDGMMDDTMVDAIDLAVVESSLSGSQPPSSPASLVWPPLPTPLPWCGDGVLYSLSRR